MGFLKNQEKKLALRYMTWQYQKRNLPLPPQWQLEKHAAQIVEDAHRIAAKRGRNVLSIIKELVEDFRKPS